MVKSNSIAEMARHEAGIASGIIAGPVRKSRPVFNEPTRMTNSLPELGADFRKDPHPAVGREIRHLRQRNKELEAEIKAYADNCRMFGINRPPDRQIAYWQEAQRLLNNAIECHYGGAVPTPTLPDGSESPQSVMDQLAADRLSQQLSAVELKKVRTRYEQRVEMTEQAQAERQSLRGELREMRQKLGGGKAWAAEGNGVVSGKGGEPMVPQLVHEMKVKELKIAHNHELLDRMDALRKELAAEYKSRSEDLSKAKNDKVQQEIECALGKSKEQQTRAQEASAHANALERKLAEVKQQAAEQLAAEEAKAKEERVELLRRQIGRRMMNSDIANGWAAWHELWSAKRYALGRLKSVARQLKAPELSQSFGFWAHDQLETRRKRELEKMLKNNESLEGRLRYALYELNQLTLVKAAQADELIGLRRRVADLSDETKLKGAELLSAAAAKKELGEMQGRLHEAADEVDDCRRRADLAESEMVKHRAGAEALLKRLLEEQRREFDKEAGELKAQLNAKTEAEKREARIEVLRKHAMRKMLHAGLCSGWGAWVELRESRLNARATLRSLGSRVGAKSLSAAFLTWTRAHYAEKRYLDNMSNEDALRLAQKERDGFEDDLKRAEATLALVTAERNTLQRKVIELGGGAEEMAAETRVMLEEMESKEKARRVETFGRQIVRRIMNDGMRKGFQTWAEAIEATNFAKLTLQKTSKRLRTSSLRDSFDAWKAVRAAMLTGKELLELRMAKEQLSAELAAWPDKYESMKADFEAKLHEAEHYYSGVLARQKVELAGTVDERAALVEAKARDERVEYLRRSAMRRVLNADLSSGWEAWLELWEAKTYAMRRLREVGARLKRPELSMAFRTWEELLALKREAEQTKALTGLQAREVQLQGEISKLEREVERQKAEMEFKLAKAEDDKAVAIERAMLELTGSTEEILALKETEAKEQRVELLRRQIGRRMMNSGVSRGFSAWHELWAAKLYAMQRLQACGNRLRAPAMQTTFGFWQSDQLEAKRVAEWRQLEAQTKSVEAQLRSARYESKQANMVQVAQEDELRALRAERSELSEAITVRDAKLAVYGHLPEDVKRLRELLEQAEIDVRDAVTKKEEAEEHVLQQLDQSKELLEKLLAEQRNKLTSENKDLKKQVATESEQRHSNGAELAHLKEESERKSKADDAEIRKLKDEIKRLTAPPPKKEPPPPKKPKGLIDLDESPDAPPIADQLANALRENSTRVLDLFRSWDADGDGQVSRAEFHKAMAALGLEVEKKIIDDLFSEWDKDGGGELGYQELVKILRAPHNKSSPSVTKKK